jgi:hypothetical protein
MAVSENHSDESEKSRSDNAAPVRPFIALGAVVGALGIVVCLLGQPSIGGALTLGALVVLIASLHRLGRSGADAP